MGSLDCVVLSEILWPGRGLFGAEVAEAFPRTPALRAGAFGDGWAGRANSSRAEYFQEHFLIAETPHSSPEGC